MSQSCRWSCQGFGLPMLIYGWIWEAGYSVWALLFFSGRYTTLYYTNKELKVRVGYVESAYKAYIWTTLISLLDNLQAQMVTTVCEVTQTTLSISDALSCRRSKAMTKMIILSWERQSERNRGIVEPEKSCAGANTVYARLYASCAGIPYAWQEVSPCEKLVAFESVDTGSLAGGFWLAQWRSVPN